MERRARSARARSGAWLSAWQTAIASLRAASQERCGARAAAASKASSPIAVADAAAMSASQVRRCAGGVPRRSRATLGREHADTAGPPAPTARARGDGLRAHHAEGARVPVARVAGELQAGPEPAGGVGHPPRGQGLRARQPGTTRPGRACRRAPPPGDELSEQRCRASTGRAWRRERQREASLDRKTFVPELVGKGAGVGGQGGGPLVVARPVGEQRARCGTARRAATGSPSRRPGDAFVGQRQRSLEVVVRAADRASGRPTPPARAARHGSSGPARGPARAGRGPATGRSARPTPGRPSPAEPST